MAAIRATLQDIKVQRDNADGTQWVVARFYSTTAGEFVGVGTLSQRAIDSPLDMVLDGEWTTTKYGRQFSFKRHALCAPIGKEETLLFLTQAPGIGPKLAERIWELYGEESIAKLLEDPQNFHVLGMNTTQIKGASLYLREQAAQINLELPLLTLIQGCGFPRDFIQQVLATFEPDPVGVLRANPFWAMQFRGVGFYKADLLRQSLKLPKMMPERLHAATLDIVLQRNSDTWIHKFDLIEAAARMTDTSVSRIRGIVDEAVKNGNLCLHRGYVALRGAVDDEMFISNWLLAKRVEKSPWWPVLGPEDGLSQHQIDEAHKAFRNGSVAFLLGYAGTGKTFTAAATIRRFGSENVLACAPTGKAAQRLGSQLKEHGLSLEPTTIHRLLKARPVNGSWEFGVDGEREQVDCELLVVDEVSMLANDIARALFRTVSHGTQVLLLGDPGQLPPVGRGAMIRDWQQWADKNPASGCTYGCLTEIRRNAGRIVEVSASVRSGRLPALSHTATPWVPAVDLTTNLRWINAATPAEVNAIVLRLAESLQRGDIDRAVGPFLPDDAQFLCLTNDSPLVGRNALNPVIQGLWNPLAAPDDDRHAIYRLGDRVINLVNNTYDGAFVANGEIGIVAASRADSIDVVFPVVGEPVTVKCANGKGPLDLAYAITIHKSQGSQWPAVIVVLTGEGKESRMASRELLYTALTRAQHLCILVGPRKVVAEAVGNTAMAKIKTFTHDWMKKADPLHVAQWAEHLKAQGDQQCQTTSQ